MSKLDDKFSFFILLTAFKGVLLEERERSFRIESVWFFNFFLHMAKEGRTGSCLPGTACVVLSAAKERPLCWGPGVGGGGCGDAVC